MIPALMLGYQVPSEMKPNQSVITELMLYRNLKKQQQKKTISFAANKLLEIKEYNLHQDHPD